MLVARSRLSRWLVAGLALLSVAGVAPVARAAAGPVGPPVGNVRYQGDISSADDSDDFVGAFLSGESLTVIATALKAPKSKDPPSLRPVLVLVDPDGVVRSAGAVTSTNGLTTAFKSFVVDKPGSWTARVSGNDGTTGAYAVSFKVKTRPRIVVKGQRLGGDMPLFRDHAFPGFEGAVLRATAVDSKKGTPVAFRHVTDPDGEFVNTPDGVSVTDGAVRKGTKLDLNGAVLGNGSGDYRIRVGIANGTASYSLTLTVTPPKRPASKKTLVLTPTEPFLDAADVPFAGEPGDTVRFTGGNFSTTTPPTVRFGTSPATSVTVGDGGTSLDVVVPPKTGSAFVDVFVVNPDGQGAVREDYFAYQPPPAITDLIDPSNLSAVRTSPAAGGRQVRLVGANILAGYVIRVGDVAVANPTYLSESDVRFRLPAMPDGNHAVTVSDPFRRTATSAFTLRYKTPPVFAASPYAPSALRVNTATSVTISGTAFAPTDQLVLQGQNVASTFVNATTRTFSAPALAEGTYTVRIVDEIGTVADGPALAVKPPPAITSVSVVSGPVLATNEIPVAGGSTVQVDGTSFSTGDTLTLGGTTITAFSVNTATRKTFVAPANTIGPVTLTITDGAGQSASVAAALRHVQLRDVTAAHEPSYDGTDDFSAKRGAAADLDDDGLVDDVVLVSPLGTSIGDRTELTRVLFGDDSGVLTDQTATAIPSAGSDANEIDSWDADCVVVGDLDASPGPEILIGGQVNTSGGAYPQVRLLVNDGSGGFSLDEVNGPPTRYDGAVQAYAYYVYSYYGYYYNFSYYTTVYGSSQQQGSPQAMALGDLDDDGDLDLVVGTDHFQSRGVYWEPYAVDFTQSPPMTNPGYRTFYTQYRPGVRIYDNQIQEEGTLADVTARRVPSAGSTRDESLSVALHSRDLALGDLDQDGDLDLVVAWDDPLTVTPYGLATLETYGASYDTPRTATRVLLNDGSGEFPNDVTSTWMPSPSDPEFWHATRIALGDLDGDSDPDLVLLLSRGLDSWKGVESRSRRALRILRNDRTRFTDVTSSALPGVVLANSDDYRGDAVAIRDLNGDGFADILVSTGETLRNGQNFAVPRTRILWGSSGISLALKPEFGVAATTDTGEADDLLFLEDLAGSGKPVLLLIDEDGPETAPTGHPLRAQEWQR